jgi:hypothetical protein
VDALHGSFDQIELDISGFYIAANEGSPQYWEGGVKADIEGHPILSNLQVAYAGAARAAAQAADAALATAEANVKAALNSNAGTSASGATTTALKLDQALQQAAANDVAANNAAAQAYQKINSDPSPFAAKAQSAAKVQMNAEKDILALNSPQQGALTPGGSASNGVGILGSGTVTFAVGLAGVGILVGVLVNGNSNTTSATSTPTTTGTPSTSTSTTSTSTTGT